ncbi:MAG: sigma-70 family RNA polymerase sigma factor [Planctomycetota bacterium]
MRRTPHLVAAPPHWETWCAVWKASAHLRLDRDPWPFIRKTALRKAFDKLREERRPVRLLTGLDPEPMTGSRPEAEIDLSVLTPQQRVCLVLFFWEGLSVTEIASELAVPPGTVKTWMFRARKRLRSTLRSIEELT